MEPSKNYNTVFEKVNSYWKSHDLYKQEGNFSNLHFASIIPGAFDPFISEFYDEQFGMLVFIHDHDQNICYFSMDDYQKTTRCAFREFMKVKKFDEMKEIKTYQSLSKKIAAHYEKYTPDFIETLTESQLIAALEEFLADVCLFLACTVFSEPIDEPMIKEFYGSIKGSKENYQTFQEMSTLPTFAPLSHVHSKAFLSFYKSKKVWMSLWSLTDYFSAPTLHEAKEQLELLVNTDQKRKDLTETMQVQTKESESNKKKADNYARTLSVEEKALFEFIQGSIKIRDLRKQISQKIMTLQTYTAIALFKKRNTPIELVPYATANDFFLGIHKKASFPEELKKRKKSFAAYYNQNEYIVVTDNVSELKKTLQDMILRQHKELSGTVAYAGKVKGTVKIILTRKDFNKIKAGDILVTSMTRPEFIPLMKLAAAVVTDEGGVTCHAAIVARELQKTCVIGTKVATSILKDGDTVEVDADNRTVKRL